jgi:hypothetical protein
VTAAQWSVITGKTFFPNLISGPFMKGLRITLSASFVMMLVAAWASWMRGAKYVHDEGRETDTAGGRRTAENAETAPVGPFGAPGEERPTPDESPSPETWIPA